MTSDAILSQFSQFIEAPAEPLRLPPWDPRVMHNHPEFDFRMNLMGAVFLIFIGHRFATLWFRYTREVLGIQWALADLLAQGYITSCGLGFGLRLVGESVDYHISHAGPPHPGLLLTFILPCLIGSAHLWWRTGRARQRSEHWPLPPSSGVDQ